MNRSVVAAFIFGFPVLAGCASENSTFTTPPPLRSATLFIKNGTNHSSPPDTVAKPDTVVTITFLVNWKWTDGVRMHAALAKGDSICFEHLLTNTGESAIVSGLFVRDSTAGTKTKTDTIASVASAAYLVDYSTGLPYTRARFSDSLALVVDTMSTKCQ